MTILNAAILGAAIGILTAAIWSELKPWPQVLSARCVEVQLYKHMIVNTYVECQK